jgi:hypothetical protein
MAKTIDVVDVDEIQRTKIKSISMTWIEDENPKEEASEVS